MLPAARCCLALPSVRIDQALFCEASFQETVSGARWTLVLRWHVRVLLFTILHPHEPSANAWTDGRTLMMSMALPNVLPIALDCNWIQRSEIVWDRRIVNGVEETLRIFHRIFSI